MKCIYFWLLDIIFYNYLMNHIMYQSYVILRNQIRLKFFYNFHISPYNRLRVKSIWTIGFVKLISFLRYHMRRGE